MKKENSEDAFHLCDHGNGCRGKKSSSFLKKPSWLRRSLPRGPRYGRVQHLLKEKGLHTVCEQAHCPNQFECFGKGTATFLLLGETCTRHCRFCNIDSGPVFPPDMEEPERVAEAAAGLGLSYVVLTSVTRDDLEDGGAKIFAESIKALRRRLPSAGVEVLIPDFMGSEDALKTVVYAKPDVINHNMETVERLYPEVRPEALYQRSLELIARVAAHESGIPAKSGIMLGLGEGDDEIMKTLRDLRQAGCRILTIGQYLQPSERHLAVKRFVPPETFDFWRKEALGMGFSAVASGPFVRSSYRAEEYRAVLETAGF
ncbi:lipoic acid synthetase [Desulfobotulus alkaliphilus]|uniref:Lipoyl synthase n=1 Tax=Desulfobotulus alkaliphilus TaxID=622671 RepID=A0A562RYW4_9BACT|nr:lipoyl synthase [Desulfobotulus alkaliphilus]TWI74285.1 lipoic acid synthetase [Desulfobotulus alkaliphilus]